MCTAVNDLEGGLATSRSWVPVSLRSAKSPEASHDWYRTYASGPESSRLAHARVQVTGPIARNTPKTLAARLRAGKDGETDTERPGQRPDVKASVARTARHRGHRNAITCTQVSLRCVLHAPPDTEGIET